MFDSDKTEMERRRKVSTVTLRDRDREAWAEKYQEICDTAYWKNGQCCAGCDHWCSDMGLLGECRAGEILSGHDIAKSMGWKWYSWTLPPGYPQTKALYKCGLFKDDFDWQSLGPEYLRKIGAKPR